MKLGDEKNKSQNSSLVMPICGGCFVLVFKNIDRMFLMKRKVLFDGSMIFFFRIQT